MNLKPPTLGAAWIFLCASLALHVIDETAFGFLSFYNPLILSIRAQVPFFPMPTFAFGPWLGGLIAAVVILSVLTPLAYKNNRWIRKLAVFLGIVMIFNGIGHTVGSFYFSTMMPGVYSSPLVFLAGILLLVSVFLYKKR